MRNLKKGLDFIQNDSCSIGRFQAVKYESCI